MLQFPELLINPGVWPITESLTAVTWGLPYFVVGISKLKSACKLPEIVYPFKMKVTMSPVYANKIGAALRLC